MRYFAREESPFWVEDFLASFRILRVAPTAGKFFLSKIVGLSRNTYACSPRLGRMYIVLRRQ